jgi:hypothetical protein
MLAGIAIIGLDHVPEDERGPPVRIAQLERALEPLLAFVGEHGQEPEQWHHGDCGQRCAMKGLGADRRGRRQRGVDGIHPALERHPPD